MRGFSWSRRQVQIVIAAFVISWGPPARASDPLLRIRDFAWTNAIRNKQPLTRFAGSTRSTPIYLWLNLAGSSAALAELQRDGKLPIRVSWRYWAFNVPTSGGISELIDAIDLSAGREASLRALRQEIDERGFFDWRAWSMKTRAQPGYWEVLIRFRDGSPVPCADALPCTFTIKLED